LLLILTGCSHQ